jgi:hypothetical protein
MEKPDRLPYNWRANDRPVPSDFSNTSITENSVPKNGSPTMPIVMGDAKNLA